MNRRSEWWKMTERLYRIDSQHFCAGIIVKGEVVTHAAPIIHYMVGWGLGKVRLLCDKKKWELKEHASPEETPPYLP